MNEELKELYRYLRLSDYRNDYILEDEYEELEDIIKRNTYAKYLERIRCSYLKGKITEEEYNNLCMETVNILKLKKGK